MARHLRANTQTVVQIGPFVDVGDGFTPETGVALTTADEAELLKHGATSTVDISGATWAAITGCDGYYALTLTTSHTDTEGALMVVVQDDSVCLPVRAEFQVLSEAAYDSLYAAKDDGFMDVNIKTVGRADTQETEANNLEAACAAYSATRGLAGTALPAAAADAAGGLPISDAGGLDLDTALPVSIANLTSVPSWPATPAQALAFLLAMVLNKRDQTSGTQQVYESDGSTVLGEAAVTDDGTTTAIGPFADP